MCSVGAVEVEHDDMNAAPAQLGASFLIVDLQASKNADYDKSGHRYRIADDSHSYTPHHAVMPKAPNGLTC